MERTFIYTIFYFRFPASCLKLHASSLTLQTGFILATTASVTPVKENPPS